jgi:hypothetical protein
LRALSRFGAVGGLDDLPSYKDFSFGQSCDSVQRHVDRTSSINSRGTKVIQDLFGVVEKVRTRPLLLVLGGLSIAGLNGEGLAVEPVWKQLLVLPVVMAMSAFALFGWERALYALMEKEPSGTTESCARIVGAALLGYCILTTLSYLATHPEGVTFAVLGDVGFVQLCALYLLGIETMKMPMGQRAR